MEIVFFYSYRMFYLFFFLILKFIHPFLFSGKFKSSLKFRFDKTFEIKDSFNKNKSTICFHAASGEIEYAFPLVKKVKELNPDINILVTLSSPSVISSLKNHRYIDAFGPAPLDTTDEVASFLENWNPQVVLFARTDIWPEYIYQISKKKIPAFLFSCTLSDNSSRLKFFSRTITQFCFNRLNFIFVVSSQDQKNISRLKIKTPVMALGDTRFDQIENKKQFPVKLKDLGSKDCSKPLGEKLFVAGSTWPEDQLVILAAIKDLPSWKWIIAPHEVDHETLDKLKTSLSQLYPNKEIRLYSGYKEHENFDILIIDEFGKLFFLYEQADACFVGGSFKRKVHSVMEPLAFYNYVFVGPYFENNREALEFSKIPLGSGINIVQKIDNSIDLVTFLKKIESEQSEAILKDKNQIRKMMQSKMSATGKIYEVIKKDLS